MFATLIFSSLSIIFGIWIPKSTCLLALDAFLESGIPLEVLRDNLVEDLVNLENLEEYFF